MMIAVEAVIAILMVPALIALGFFWGRAKAITGPSAPKVIAAVTHRLVKASVKTDRNGSSLGWYYECSCGRIQPALPTGNYYKSTEQLAVQAWKRHAETYKDIPDQPTEERKEIERLKAELKSQLDRCFCKDLET